MKVKYFAALCLTMLCATLPRLASAGGDRVDLSSRRAIYLTGKKSVIDLKNDKYVAAGGTIKVKKSDAISCAGNKCTYGLGTIAFRNGTTTAMKTYGQFSGKASTAGNTILFQDNETTKQHVLPVELAVGANVVTFTIDPENKIAETNENNNNFSVTIIVE